ncbi:unnamed protein product [Chondrus crispus]|uniref:Uncharacterized protein n=1 Tax=Chondrus crispus TaxID=2769 RepID=R7QFJ8_CHOCR|nr:unnamed protein product [Chondrus crispus]CDF37307.1 unnamed protein product [Chondrus crispus]|eukprot:XP_005717126.1 unnamed protein product [Chondrus crispus]
MTVKTDVCRLLDAQTLALDPLPVLSSAHSYTVCKTFSLTEVLCGRCEILQILTSTTQYK